MNPYQSRDLIRLRPTGYGGTGWRLTQSVISPVPNGMRSFAFQDSGSERAESECHCSLLNLGRDRNATPTPPRSRHWLASLARRGQWHTPSGKAHAGCKLLRQAQPFFEV